jgi:hypothetical protein
MMQYKECHCLWEQQKPLHKSACELGCAFPVQMSEAILQPVPEKVHKNDTVLYKQIEVWTIIDYTQMPEKQDAIP